MMHTCLGRWRSISQYDREHGSLKILISTWKKQDITHSAKTSTMNAEEAPVDGRHGSSILEPSYSSGIKHVHKVQVLSTTYNIIQSTGDAWLPLTLFHSTFLANALTHDFLVIACPLYTLNMCGMRQHECQASSRTQKVFDKYVKRGFGYVNELPKAQRTNAGGPMFIPLDHSQPLDSSEHILRRVFEKGWASRHFIMFEEERRDREWNSVLLIKHRHSI